MGSGEQRKVTAQNTTHMGSPAAKPDKTASHRIFLRMVESSHGRDCPSGHLGIQNQVPRRKTEIRIKCVFLAQTEERKRRKGPGRQLWAHRGHKNMSFAEWGEETKRLV